MKRYLIVAIALLAFIIHGKAFALDGEGTIEEVRVCSFGHDNWMNYVFFRLSDGTWFGTYGTYHNSSASSKGPNSTVVSTVLTAFSGGHPVDVRATYATKTECGVTAEMLWKTDGDYISMTRD